MLYKGVWPLTGQHADEVALQHGLEVRVDVPVLVVAHARQQLLHKLHLQAMPPSMTFTINGKDILPHNLKKEIKKPFYFSCTTEI